MTLAAALAAADVYLHDGFLAAPELKALSACLQERRRQSAFAAARIGAAPRLQRNPGVRGDYTCWLQEPLFPAERELLDRFEQMRLALNRELFWGLFDLEMHYAWYPPGAVYERHVDQPHGEVQRQVSLVLYLNEAWPPDAGGELRLFDAAGGSRDIAPLGGRLVCFRTIGREHGVLPARRDRFSLSGWFRTRD